MRTDFIRRGQVQVLINGEGIPPITEDTRCMGIDRALVGNSYTVAIGPMRMNARTYRYLLGERMPGSVQTTFQYAGARGRREKRIRKHHWRELKRAAKGMAVFAEEVNRALESLGLAMTSVQDAMKENP